MKLSFILVIFFITSAASTYAQTEKPDWSKLPGVWKIEKALSIRSGDTTSFLYTDKVVVYSFDAAGVFTDSTSQKNTVFKGAYTIDKTKNSITFPGIIQTTKFPGTSYKDYVAPSYSFEVFVLKLTKDEFIYYNRICDEVLPTCINYTYFKKVGK